MRSRTWTVVILAALCGSWACRKDAGQRRWQEKSEVSIDLFDQGLYLDARLTAQEAARIAEESFGSGDIRTAYALDHLGKVYRRTGELEKARALFERAVKISGQALEEDNPKQTHFYDNLAELLMTEGKYDEAEDIYGKSLRVLQGSFGEFSAPVAAAYTRLAVLFTRWGVFEEAEKLFRRVEAINARISAPDENTEAAMAVHWGELRLLAGNRDQAKELCGRGLALRERLPKNHLDLARARSVMGLLLLREGRPDEAQRALDQAVETYRLSPSADPQGLLDCWLNMAEVYSAQGKDKEAEELFAKLLPRYSNPYSLVKAALRAGGHYQRRGRLDAAESLYMQGLAKQVESPKADKVDRESLLLRLAEVSAGRGRLVLAEGYYKRALQANEELHGELHLSSVDVWGALALVYAKQGRLDLAERCVARIEKVGKAFGPRNPIRRGVERKIAQAYRAMGRKDKAAKLEREADFGSE